MNNLQCVGVLAHPRRPNSAPVARRIADSLEAHGLQSWYYSDWDEDSVIADVRQADMVVAIGGDGAMLRAARVCAPHAVPVLGVNMGRLGFLTEIASPDDWEPQLPVLLNNQYWIETRMMITARVRREGEFIASADALNDVVISGSSVGHMIQLDTYIDTNWATTYNADSLIIATPTGSTAYALAVGGPILPPDLLNILIVPSAPHLSMDRPLVLSEGSRVAVRPVSINRYPIVVMADGTEIATLEPGDSVHIRACSYSSRFVRIRERNYFYRSLLDRLEPRVNRDVSEHEPILEDD